MQAWKFYKIHSDIMPDYIHVINIYTKPNWFWQPREYVIYRRAGYTFERTGRVSDFHIISEISSDQFEEYDYLVSKPVWSQ